MRSLVGMIILSAVAGGCGLRADVIRSDGSIAQVSTDRASLEWLDEAWERGSMSTDSCARPAPR